MVGNRYPNVVVRFAVPTPSPAQFVSRFLGCRGCRLISDRPGRPDLGTCISTVPRCGSQRVAGDKSVKSGRLLFFILGATKNAGGCLQCVGFYFGILLLLSVVGDGFIDSFGHTERRALFHGCLRVLAIVTLELMDESRSTIGRGSFVPPYPNGQSVTTHASQQCRHGVVYGVFTG